MPTFERTARFLHEFTTLTPVQQAHFLDAVGLLVTDLRAKALPRPSLRVKRIQGTEEIWELTWAADGRATFQYGPERLSGDAHVQCRRIGSHAIFSEP